MAKNFLLRPSSMKINTSYLTDSYIGITLKMESVSKNTIFGLKMMVKNALEKNRFEIPPPSVIKITIFPHGGISK